MAGRQGFGAGAAQEVYGSGVVWCAVWVCVCVCVSGTLVCSQLLENGRQAAPSGTFPSLLRAASWSGSQPKHSRPNLDARLPRLGWIFNFASHFLNGCPTQDGQSEGLRSIACFSRPRPPPLHQPARASQPASQQPHRTAPAPAPPAPTKTRRGAAAHSNPSRDPGACTCTCTCTAQAQPGSQNGPRPTSNAA